MSELKFTHLDILRRGFDVCKLIMYPMMDPFCCCFSQEDFDDASDWDDTEEPARPPPRLELYMFTS